MIDGYRIRFSGDGGSIPFENRSDRLDELRLVFVLGCPRSGTTFLLRSLSRLPRTRVHAGALIPDRLCHVVAAAAEGDPRVDDILHAFRAVLWKTFVSGVTSRLYHARAALADPGSAGTALSVLAGRREVDLARHGLVYKEPFMAFTAERLAAHFVGARIVHLVRDGRDCADSLDRTYGAALSDEVLRADGGLWRQMGSEVGVARRRGASVVPWWVAEGREDEFLAASRFERYLWMWAECVTRARRANAVAPGRYLELRYEGLCREPEVAARSIEEFLGVERSRRFRRAIGNARTSSVGIARRGRSSTPSTEEADRLLRELGYQP